MTRKTLIGVVLALAVFTGGVFAQDYIFTFRGGHVDTVLGPAPCAPIGPASMAVYDHSAWIVYTCAGDGHVVLQRYLNAQDDDREPLPVYTVPNPNASAPPTAPATVACTVPGMVTSIYGGCVPPNHPNAPR